YRLEASLGFLRKGEYQRAREELEEVQEGLDTTLAELRHTTAALHPPELEKVGLVKALARYVGVFERDTAIPCLVEENGPVPRLSAPVELAVFRVVQEALSNIRKHSKATEAQVDIGLHKESFRAVVRDNGIGFEVDDSQRIDNGHLGLAGMRERARILGGTLDIHSALGAGTQVILQVLLSQTPSTLDQQVEVAMEPKTKPRRLEVAV
ncbi:MAG: sensor histidine kinase, partial [Dehalococcoidia bacterium]